MSLSKKDTHQVNILERSVTELKSAIKLFVTASKGESDDLDGLLDSMLAMLDTEEASFTFSQLVNNYRKNKNLAFIERSEKSRELRIEIVQLIKECSTKSLSTTQTDLLSSLVEKARDKSNSDEEVLFSFGKALLVLSEDIESSRIGAAKVVDDNHKHIKQNSADVVAADIQTASRRLTREISQLASKLSKSYPYDTELRSLCTEANALANSPNQFFKSLDLLQNLNKHISNLIQKERVGTQEMLIDIQNKIVDIFKHSAILNKSIDDSSNNADNLATAMQVRLEALKEQAQNSGSVEDLQSLISESILSISDAYDTFSKRQHKINLQNKNHIRTLSSELQDAHKKIKAVQNKLDSAEEEVFVDELSQLGNRKGYLKNIRKSHDLWRTGRHKLSVIVLDIDRFKTINDTYGHVVGDQVIKKLSNIIKDNIRSNDYVARYGGEEFVIICNDASAEDAAKVAEKIRADIAKRKFKLRASEGILTVTSSFGVSEFTDHRNEVVAVFNAADKALYKAKESGRNKVVMVKNNQLLQVNNTKG